MPRLGVRIRPASPDLFHLEIYHGDTHIGDYERTKESEIPRKLEEIKRGARFLSNAYAKHENSWCAGTVETRKSGDTGTGNPIQAGRPNQ